MNESVQEPVHAMEPLESGHRKPEAKVNVRSAIANATTLLGSTEERTVSSNSPVANSKDVFVSLPTGIDSMDIKSAICGLWAFKLHSTATKSCMEGHQTLPSTCW